MESEHIYSIFVALLIVQQIAESALIALNVNYAKQSSENLPQSMAGLYDPQQREKALRYTITKGRFAIFSATYSLAGLLLVLHFDLFAKLDRALSHFEFTAISVHGTLFLLLIMAASAIYSLPLSYYATFVVEENFGFNKTSVRQWIKDRLLSLFISAIIGGILIFLLLIIMQRLGEWWWIYAAVTIIASQIFIAFIYPLWIAPLFNKFTEVEEGELRSEIEKMVEKAGYKSTGVYSVDGSKRSRHANAYFAGLGRSKRIALFDTLIDLLTPRQIAAVLAHEIGHEKLHHIKKSLILSAGVTLLLFYCLSIIYREPAIYAAFGFSAPSNHAALLIFSLLFGPIAYFISPLFNALSRRYEYQADRFAVSAVGSPEPLVSALLKLSKNSLSNLNPHPLYTFMHYSHPALAERIGAMEKMKE